MVVELLQKQVLFLEILRILMILEYELLMQRKGMGLCQSQVGLQQLSWLLSYLFLKLVVFVVLFYSDLKVSEIISPKKKNGKAKNNEKKPLWQGKRRNSQEQVVKTKMVDPPIILNSPPPTKNGGRYVPLKEGHQQNQ